MKTRQLRIITIFLFCALLLGAFLGCAGRQYDPNSNNTTETSDFIPLYTNAVTPDELKTIQSDWTKQFPGENAPPFRHYGTYNDSAILFVSNSFGIITTTIKTCAEIDFVYHSDFTLYGYKDHSFLLLEEAYEEGWITKEDIQTAVDYHNSLNPPSLQPVDIKLEATAEPNSIPSDTLQDLLTAYNEKFNASVTEMYHYGTYGGTAVFFVPNEGEEKTTVEIIKGTVFKYGTEFSFISFSRGLFFDGLKNVTVEQISRIGTYHDSTLSSKLQRTYVELPEEAAAGTLSNDKLAELKSAYEKDSGVKVDSIFHYGTSNGVTALFIPLGTGEETTFKFWGETITYDSEFILVFYHDGMFLKIYDGVEYWFNDSESKAFWHSVADYHQSRINQ